MAPRVSACVRVCVPDPLFVAFVQDNALWWFQRGYAPKNGVAGVRGKPYKLFRDHVILEALRIYRARTEGVSLDAVPPVVYSWKPSGGHVGGGQRGIVGFERCKALVPATPCVEELPLPIDAEQTLLPDSKADALAAGLEQMYYEALAGVRVQVVRVKRRRDASAPPAKRSRTLMEFAAQCNHAFVKEPSPGFCNSCGAIDSMCSKCGSVVCVWSAGVSEQGGVVTVVRFAG